MSEIPSSRSIFFRVAKHLLKQGVKARSDHGMCVYRTSNGRQCAVGCLIPPEHYDPSFEGHGIYGLWNWFSRHDKEAIFFSLFGKSKSLLTRLQVIHDEREPEYWESELIIVASDFALPWPLPETEAEYLAAT